MIGKTKNGFLSFWAFAPTQKMKGKPKTYKTKYVEVPKGWVTVKRYARYWGLNIETVNSACSEGRIKFILSRRNRYVQLKNEYLLFNNKLKYLDKQYELELLFKKYKKINLAAKELNIPVGTARNMLKEFRLCNPEYLQFSNHFKKPLYKKDEFIKMVEKKEKSKDIAKKFNIAISTVFAYKKKIKMR